MAWNKVAAALSGLTFLFATSALGAEITVVTDPDAGQQMINIDGELTTADPDDFAKIAARFHSAVVSFDSDGGNLVAGIKIGETIRQRRFETIIRDGKSCASACALAWLAGTERTIEGTGRVGFHAAYDAQSGQETGVGNALLGAYVAKLGLSYSAVIYFTKAAPNQMTWLNISEAAALGIRVAFASPATTKAVLALPTRFGNVDILKLADDDNQIRYKSSRMKILLNEHGYAHLEAVFRVSAGDLLIISTPSNVRGIKAITGEP